ncbi:MAG: transcriptional repressor [Campylobacterota bacterium]|nr:transcriptional repressor [Campylobacterota bacterium]
MNRLQKCIDRKRVNSSRPREAIYKILLNSKGCLTVGEIAKKLLEQYGQKASTNTIYRHLRFFIDCELVFMIQDDLKKAYYFLCADEAKIFSICTKCNKIENLEVNVCSEFKDADCITIHEICQECKQV